MKKIGIIGGSGIYDIDELENVEHNHVQTPFGEPSDDIISGKMGETHVFFLARHGKGHRHLPSEINYRANIHAFKQLGVDKLISVSAVGSMLENISPGTMVLPSQFIDRTFRRVSSFYGSGIVGHVSFAEPVCKMLQDILYTACQDVGVPVSKGGTYVCIEGPQFSTRAESLMYRQLGVSVIGMTNMPEAKLAREAGMSYATLALATDYDCWHETEEAVTLDSVMKVMKRNASHAKKIISCVAGLVGHEPSPYRGTFKNSVVTSLDRVPPATLDKLKFLLSH